MRDAVVGFLASAFPDASVRLEPLPAFGLRSAPDLRRLWRSVRWADAVVLVGGTHFHDGYGRRSARILLTHLALFGGIRLTGTSVGFAGIGVGPLSTRLGRWLVRAISACANVTLVRDPQSAALLRAIGTGSPVIEGADSAVLLPPPPRAPSSIPTLGISLIPYFSVFEGRPDLDAEMVADVGVALVRLASAHRFRVHVLAFNTQGFISDQPVCEDLAGRLAPHTEVELSTMDSPTAALECLRHLDWLVATRYHAALLGFLAELPLLVVGYEDKNFALAADIRLPEHATVSPRELLGTGVAAHLERLITAPDDFRARRAPSEMAATAQATLASFFSSLGVATPEAR
jgi:polysaccharide pyruvyl transferase WcaK-like protein